MRNIENMRDVLDILLRREYEIREVTSKINCIEYVPHCDNCGEGNHLKLYYNKTTGVIIENYQEQLAIKRKIQKLQEQLKALQTPVEENEIF